MDARAEENQRPDLMLSKALKALAFASHICCPLLTLFSSDSARPCLFETFSDAIYFRFKDIVLLMLLNLFDFFLHGASLFSFVQLFKSCEVSKPWCGDAAA